MNIIITEREKVLEPEPVLEPEIVELPDLKMSEDERQAAVEEKRQAKREAKKDVGRKFKVGEEYWMKVGGVKKTYKLIKTIYSVGPNAVASLVMMQTGGPVTNTYTLNEHDCKRYHIKYQSGLQVFSMKLKWNRIRK